MPTSFPDRVSQEAINSGSFFLRFEFVVLYLVLHLFLRFFVSVIFSVS